MSFLVALGDSASVGVGAGWGNGWARRLHERLRAVQPGSTLKNLGGSGARVDGVRHEQIPRLLSAPAAPITAIVCAIGTNDVVRQTPVDRFRADYTHVTEKLARTGAPVVVANVADLSLCPVAYFVPPSFYAERLAQVNRHVAEAAERHGFALADLHAHSRALGPGRSELFSDDGFHPSAAGYEEWTKCLWAALEPLLGRQARKTA